MILVVMGVCGCGKTTVGEALAKKFGCEFRDADEFHSETNKTKMSKSVPLTDEDRIPWLKSIHAFLKSLHYENKTGVVTCSALKRFYRQILRTGETTQGDDIENLPIVFVYLKGTYKLLMKRMEARKGHFMPASLLKSQLETLEEPDSSEFNVVTVDIANSVEDIVETVITAAKAGIQ